MTSARVLYVPRAETPTILALAIAARSRGLDVVAVADLGNLDGPIGYVFGGPRFAGFVAEHRGLALLEPTDGWLPSLPEQFVRRSITLMRASGLAELDRAVFVKQPREKGLEARVYPAGRLPGADTIGPDELVLVSDPVEWKQEYRLFVLDQCVVTGSRYRSYGRADFADLDDDPDASAVRSFAAELLECVGGSLPSGVVIDVGWIARGDTGRELAVVEANMAWFSNRYECDPDAVLDVVMRAAGPRAEVRNADKRFIR